MAVPAANPPAGQAANDDVALTAVFMDAAAVKQAAGSDFNNGFTVIEVTVTPKGGKSVDLQPDDFLLRIGSTGDHSGPLAASQVLGTGGLVLHKEDVQVIGATRTQQGWNGAAMEQGKTPPAPASAINELKSKMLPTGVTSVPVTGLLFFPIEKKKPKDLDLVYTTSSGKLHISFR
jgi:hypothetical protein